MIIHCYYRGFHGRFRKLERNCHCLMSVMIDKCNFYFRQNAHTQNAYIQQYGAYISQKNNSKFRGDRISDIGSIWSAKKLSQFLRKVYWPLPTLIVPLWPHYLQRGPLSYQVGKMTSIHGTYMYEDKSLMSQGGLFLRLAIHLGISSLVKYICSQVFSIQLRMGCLLILSANTLLPFKCKKKETDAARFIKCACGDESAENYNMNKCKRSDIKRRPNFMVYRVALRKCMAACSCHDTFLNCTEFLFQVNIMSFFGSVRNMYNLMLFTSKYPDKTKLI